MRRAFANLLCSLLLVSTLVWGGCISCEQFFMLPGAKSCCAPNGRCKTKTAPTPQTGPECKQIAFGHQKSVDLHVDLPILGVVASDSPLHVSEPLTGRSDLDPVDPSPPNLRLLYST